MVGQSGIPSGGTNCLGGKGDEITVNGRGLDEAAASVGRHVPVVVGSRGLLVWMFEIVGDAAGEVWRESSGGIL